MLPLNLKIMSMKITAQMKLNYGIFVVLQIKY
jgi:hypothetical protein